MFGNTIICIYENISQVFSLYQKALVQLIFCKPFDAAVCIIQFVFNRTRNAVG